MPFVKRAIEPVHLNRWKGKDREKVELDGVSNHTLVGVFLQLGSLVQHADELFADLTQNCQEVIYRTQRIRNRVIAVTDKVENLNARAVKVPESTLENFANIGDHHQSDYGYLGCMFTPASRPESLRILYRTCEPNPISTIRRCNAWRSDGKTGSKIFSVPLVLQNEKMSEIDNDLDVRRSIPEGGFERSPKKLKDPTRLRNSRPQSISTVTELDKHAHKDEIPLPTPQQRLREISRSQPVTLVPIDTSGFGFKRMCEIRSSSRGQIPTEESTCSVDGTLTSTAKRKRNRRQTVSGIPGHIYAELTGDNFKASQSVTNLNRTRSASKDRWERSRSYRSITMDMYIPQFNDSMFGSRRSRSKERKSKKYDRDDSPVGRSCSLRRSFRSLFKDKRSKSIDLWAEGRPESPGPPIIDLEMPLRRSRSLPRSLRGLFKGSIPRLTSSRAASTEGRLDVWDRDDEVSLMLSDISSTQEKTPIQGKPPKAPGRSPAGRFPSIRKSKSYHMGIGAAISGTYLDTDPPSLNNTGRPMSMDLEGLRQPIPVRTPVTPAGARMTSEKEKSIMAKMRMNIPPWATSFADDVRLRQHENLAKDDRQSSSGNWSASSSSARQSLESDFNKSPKKGSQTSLDKDSACSLNLTSSNASDQPSEDRYTTTDNNNGEDTSTICDESTINGDDEAPDDASSANGSVINVKANFTKMSAEDWLSTMDKDKGKRDSRSQRRQKSRSVLLSGSSDESMGSKSGTLTRQLLKAHDHAHLPMVRHASGMGDEESSVYSQDQDGFYTSMHKDSGLKSNFADLILEEDIFASSTPVVENTSKRDKRRSYIEERRKRGSKKNKKTPPPPPPRDSSTLSKSNLTLHMDESGPTSPAPNQSMDRSKRAGSNDTTISEQSNNSKNKQYESASESDAEAIYARIKVKSSISAAAIPSLCSVTPLNSDEEDLDMLAYSTSWRTNDTPSSVDTSTWTAKSTPDFRPTLHSNHFTSTPNAYPDHRPKVADFSLTSDPTLSSFSITSATKDDSFTEAEKPADSSLNLSDYSSGCSTWPRSPNSKGDSSLFGSLLKTVEKKPPRPQISQMFNSPDNLDGKGDEKLGSSFKGSNDGSIGPSSSKSGGSGSTTTLSSIPSSTGDDPPSVPDKYKPSITITPRSRSTDKSKGLNVPAPIREHVYANVIVQDSSAATSAVQTVSITKNTSHYATSSVTAKSEPKVSTSTFTSSPYAVGGLASSHTVKSTVPLTSANPSTSSAITSPASSGPPSRALSPTGKVFAVPMPAPAKLIISSPVSGQVSFKENPYKRSVCSPVSTEELLTNWSSVAAKEKGSQCYNSLPRKPNSPSGPGAAKQLSTLNLSPEKKETVSPVIITNQEFEYSTLPKKRLGGAFDHIHSVSAASTPASHKPSQPLFPSISAMKHSVSFPVTEKEVIQQKEKQEPGKESTTKYGGSWYDGIKTEKKNGMPNSDSINSIASFMSAPPRSCFAPNRNSADSFTFGHRRDSIASTISTDSSGRSKSGFLSSILKASPSGSKSSVRTDEDAVSIASSRSDEKPPTFSSFTKPPSLGLPLSIKRTASVGSAGSEGSGKGVIPAVPPVVPGSTSSVTAQSNQQPVSRPTSLAISPTTELGSKRTRPADQHTEQDGQTEAKALILTTITENDTPKSTKPPRPSPVRVVYPPTPVKSQKSPSPDAGPSFGKPKAKVIVSAQKKRNSLPTSDQIQPSSPKFDIPPNLWSAPNKADTKLSETESNRLSFSSFAPIHNYSSSTLETTKSGVPLPPARDSSLPRKTTIKAQATSALSSVDGKSGPEISSSTTFTTTGTTASSTLTNSSTVGATSAGLPRYPIFVKPKASNTNTTITKSSLPEAPSSDNKIVAPSSGPSLTSTNYETKPRSLSISSHDSGNGPQSTSLHNMSFNSLNKSTNSLALSVFSGSNVNLNKSSLSLYKSSESLASTNSNHADKNRAAKLAFLNGSAGGDANSNAQGSPKANDPFSRFKVGARKSSTGSTGSSCSSKSITSNGHIENTNNSNSESSENNTPTHKLRHSPPKGRFVSSKIEQLRQKSIDSPPSSPESPSSGLGSSICSPLSPMKSPAGSTTDFTNFNGHQMAVNNNVKDVILEKPTLVS